MFNSNGLSAADVAAVTTEVGGMTGGQLLLSSLFSEDSETEEDFSAVMVDQAVDAVLQRLAPICRQVSTTRLLQQN